MKLGQLLQAHQNDLPITPRHEAWLAQNDTPSYSDEAKAFMAEQIGKPQRDRTKTFSASGAGMCPRRRQFEYLGITKLKRKPRTGLVQIFHNGTYMHLRWQMAGLTDGWMTAAEVPVANEKLAITGTLDGLSYRSAGIELKSINSNGFRDIMQHGPKRIHLRQTNNYVLSGAPDVFSIIYEDKDTQDYKEFVHVPTVKELINVREEQERLVELTVNEELAEVKDYCYAKEGTEYIQCPFRDICPTVRNWKHGEELACGSSDKVLRLRPTSSSPQL